MQLVDSLKQSSVYTPIAFVDDDTQKQKYIDDCKAVKEKYPK